LGKSRKPLTPSGTGKNVIHPKASERFRRVAPLVLYWHDDRLLFDNFAIKKQITADPVVCSILQFCGDWRSVREIESDLRRYDPKSVQRTVRQLYANGMLERAGDHRDPRLTLMEGWRSWNPAAGFFHFSTKDVEFAEDPWESMRTLEQKAKSRPLPLPVKAYRNSPRITLPRANADTEFARVLQARRTWRKYSHEAVSLEALATTLDLTFGIQNWAELPGLGRAAMKTSPSGGSLHPIEAYVVARRVANLRPGIYHYHAENHSLEWLRSGLSKKILQRNLGHQHWFANTAFLILMTAVFARTQWKYEFPRVYRSILLEAGHLCQTFCLTATWQGLAPWCTIALADSRWECLLGIDGISESLIYAAGAGAKPADERNAHIGRIICVKQRNKI
jgi:SagB-type dehydrogenase family enzyme